MNPDLQAIGYPFKLNEQHIRRNQAIRQGEIVHNTLAQYLTLDHQDFIIPERLPQVVLPTRRDVNRRDLNAFYDLALKESDNLSQVKVQEKKVFTLYQIFEKLDSFIAEVTMLEDVKVVVGGSLGLLLQGYVLDRLIGDLDILIECSTSQKTSLKRQLEVKYPVLRTSDSTDFQLAIGFGGLKIDI